MNASLFSIRFLGLCVAGCALLTTTACADQPEKLHQQFVARDAWNKRCAPVATVEKFEATNRRWKIKNEVYVVDVKATFKLLDDCKGIAIVQKSFKAFESVDFEKKGLELSKCKREGKTGWSLPGFESTRCFTGGASVPKALLPKSIKK